MMNFKALSVPEMLRIRAGNQETPPTGGESGTDSGTLPAVENLNEEPAALPVEKPGDVTAMENKIRELLKEKKQYQTKLKEAEPILAEWEKKQKEEADKNKTLEQKIADAENQLTAAKIERQKSTLAIALISNGVPSDRIEAATKLIFDGVKFDGITPDSESIKSALSNYSFLLHGTQAPATTTGAPRGNAPGNNLSTWVPVADLEAEFKKNRGK